MFDLVLVQPQIPPNTGNVIRLSANIGARLHLIEPLGFVLDDARLRRAGLDYHEYAQVRVHADLDSFIATVQPRRMLALSTRGTRLCHDVEFVVGDALLFGSETSGLAPEVLARLPSENILKLPMVAGSRSLNLSNAVAVVAYEAWRQLRFAGAVTAG
jgi:tRNA (cytidine/uridine-2'-O-)-methyltransferase